MLSAIKSTFMALAIFIGVPIFTIAINWQWQPDSLNRASEFLFWITETAGLPWAILTCIFFTVIFIICLNIHAKLPMIKLLLILVTAILFGHLIKTIVKNYTADSRPFVLWIESNYHVDDEYFYSLPRSERRHVIKEYVYNSPQIPHWLYKYWRNETGYTFPSGHTLFAATWAFLALVLLNFKRHYIIVSLIIAWVLLIEISRIALGMHHPIDVLCGLLIAWIIALFAYYFARRWQVIKV